MSSPDDRPLWACSFCGKDQAVVARLIAGPDHIAICDECVVLCNEILQEETQRPARPVEGEAYCVICGKAQAEVAHLISGPNGPGICSDCVDTCHGIAHRQQPVSKAPAEEPGT